MSLHKRGDVHHVQLQFSLGGQTRRIQASTGCGNVRAASEVERKIRLLVEYRIAGLDPGPDLTEWVQGLPAGLLKSLAAAGLVAAEVATPVADAREQIEAYLRSCAHEGQVRMHIDNKRRHLTRLVEAIGAKRVGDITANRMQAFLQELKTSGRSHRTVNQHLMTTKTFMSWCVRQGLLTRNPLSQLRRLNESHDRRLVRRPFTRAELTRLLDSAPPERAIIYRFAAMTGLRRSELRQIEYRDLDLAGSRLTVRGEVAKNRRESVLPLHPELVNALQNWLSAEASPTDRLFRTIPRFPQIHRDLERAGIQRIDANGQQVDLHAMRTTFATELIRQGTPLPVVQRLTRHQTIDVLVNHYARLSESDTTDAVQKMSGIAEKRLEAQTRRRRTADGVSGPDGAQTYVVRNAVTDAPQGARGGAKRHEDPRAKEGIQPVAGGAQGGYIARDGGERRDPALATRRHKRHSSQVLQRRAISSVG